MYILHKNISLRDHNPLVVGYLICNFFMIDENLREIVPLIARVVDGQSLSAKDAKKAFTATLLHDKEGFYSLALMTAIHAKGETADELLGLVNAYRQTSIRLNKRVASPKLIDLSGTGGGNFKTINVSSIAAFIVSASGYIVPKASYYGITSPTGSADVFGELGIDVKKITKRQIESVLDETNICPFFIPFISPKLANRAIVSRKIFDKLDLHIKSPFHLVTNVYSPMPLKYRLYGCYSTKYLETLAQLFSKLNFRRALIVHGEIGIPEVSNVGKTVMIEQNGQKIKRSTVSTEELGVRRARASDIQTGGKEQNVIDFLRVLQGKELGPKADLVAVNAAAAFYILGESKSIAGSVPKAKEIIKSGEGFITLRKLVGAVGSQDRLNFWLKRA